MIFLDSHSDLPVANELNEWMHGMLVLCSVLLYLQLHYIHVMYVRMFPQSLKPHGYQKTVKFSWGMWVKSYDIKPE